MMIVLVDYDGCVSPAPFEEMTRQKRETFAGRVGVTPVSARFVVSRRSVANVEDVENWRRYLMLVESSSSDFFQRKVVEVERVRKVPAGESSGGGVSAGIRFDSGAAARKSEKLLVRTRRTPEGVSIVKFVSSIQAVPLWR